jgi:hypothetical protein
LIRRLMLAAAVASAAAAFVLPAAPAQAVAFCQTNEACTFTFYTNSAKTTINGQEFWACNGTKSSWGVLTGIEVVTTSFC